MKALKKKVIALSLTAILVPALVAHAYAHNDKRGRSGHEVHKILKKLDLTDHQKANVKAIFKTQKVDAEAHRSSFKQLQASLAEQIKQDKWDEAKVISIQTQLQQLKSQGTERKAETKEQVWLLLTSEQQDKWLAMQKKRMSKMPKKADERMAKKQHKIVNKLALTDEQKEVVEPLLTKLNENRQQMMTLKLELKEQEFDLYAAKQVDMEKLAALHQSQLPALQDIALENANLYHRVWHNLDADQQAKFEGMMKRFKQNGRGKRGRHHG